MFGVLDGGELGHFVLILEYLPGAMTLKDVPCNLITDEVVESLVSTVASFGLLGVTHCDLNVTNILFEDQMAYRVLSSLPLGVPLRTRMSLRKNGSEL